MESFLEINYDDEMSYTIFLISGMGANFIKVGRVSCLAADYMMLYFTMQQVPCLIIITLLYQLSRSVCLGALSVHLL